ncbi:MAG: DUF2726 domain-containing protein [Bacillota bacterium]|nr:DUF2726 domain-containing protein [Bacillota bacterium]
MENNRTGCLSVFLPFLRLKSKDTNKEEILPYVIRDDFLSPSELSFYKILTQAIGQDMKICPKVGLKDIFFVKSGDKKMSYLNKINRRHIDFLICNPVNLVPICCIELDDSSHQRAKRVIKDNFLDKLFIAAKLPLIRFINKRGYSLTEVKEKIQAALESKKETQINLYIQDKEKAETIPDIFLNKEELLCPKCNIPMILREVKKGTKKGTQFWGCSNYPKCRETLEHY